MKNQPFKTGHLLTIMLLLTALTTAIAQSPVIVMNPIGLKPGSAVSISSGSSVAITSGSITVTNIDKANTKDVAITSGSIAITNIPAEIPINSQSSVTVSNIIESNTRDVVITSGSITVNNIDAANTKDVVITSGTLTISGATSITGSTVNVASAYISSGVAGKLTGVTNFTLTPADYLFSISFLMKDAANTSSYVTINANWRSALPPIADGDSIEIKCEGSPVKDAIFTGSCLITSTITWNANTGVK